MFGWVRRGFRRAYERVLHREIGDGPTHVAIIQDGNRRYARKRGDDAPDGHRAGAQTTENVLEWCEELGIEELTLYAFSTENFDRPPEEREHLFDLFENKLYESVRSEQIHDREVAVRVIGEVDRLPERVRDAVEYAESETADYDKFTLNIALAYGGRAELLSAARDVCHDVEAGKLSADDVDVAAVDAHLSRQPVRDVDLIIRTGGDERISNFLPWHANGNEAAVYFCAPYWPEFSKTDFLRGIRTYESREKSWQRTRTERAVALVRAVAEVEFEDARAVASRLREQLSSSGADEVSAELAKRTDETAD
ncbi:MULTISPECIES: polyprenyl diphosphate synthase [Haloferax]|uniref:Tritrans,polycis-undecaprenyl-diphosphate synthase (geranylgeranyl-diphosphate specific) n=2 Tax=Haloferax TaxID=2251 RepID=A0A6G1Z142_9EURY|nr:MULTISPECIES: polyprenyl diphosphate synthase [Haloferax]KAB1187650.1 di-trans,poly-cis-decaprenylcistransferase [Haloferax sp. CBA1149]MRW80309.1 di-trans,poly-cis-decaprenylcistransferase [Haloferax marinisediminis]